MKQTLKFTNGDELEIGTMFCIGQNYAKHAAEMGSQVSEEPTVFLKPPQAYIENNCSIIHPEYSSNVHHEVELVVVIGKDCQNINEEKALDFVAGYAVGIDVTLRDLQGQAKKEGKPWAVAKGFFTSAPISKVVPAQNIHQKTNHFLLKLEVNGQVKQSGSTSEMERSVENLVSYLSKVFTLNAGDVIFTGTPEGVGKINKGDKLHAELVGFVDLDIKVE